MTAASAAAANDEVPPPLVEEHDTSIELVHSESEDEEEQQQQQQQQQSQEQSQEQQDADQSGTSSVVIDVSKPTSSSTDAGTRSDDDDATEIMSAPESEVADDAEDGDDDNDEEEEEEEYVSKYRTMNLMPGGEVPGIYEDDAQNAGYHRFTVRGLFSRVEDDVEEENEKLDMKDPKKQHMMRENFEGPIYLIPIEGMEGEEFFHMDEYDEPIDGRDVLMQSLENYETCRAKDFKGFPKNEEAILKDPRFGEQVLVDGITPHSLCLGDMIAVVGSTLRLQVASPRKPCQYLDRKNKTPFGAKGIKQFSLDSGLGGWFCRVLYAGNLSEENILVVTDRPHPQWTIGTLSQAVYGGEGDPKAFQRARASWGRSKEELQSLIEIDALPDYEWKDELRELLNEMEASEQDAVKANDRDGSKMMHSAGAPGQDGTEKKGFANEYGYAFLAAALAPVCIGVACMDLTFTDSVFSCW